MTSKTEQCIEYIANHGPSRTTKIAQAVGCNASDVGTLLRPHVETGLLIVCKIEQPGKPPTNEYKLGTKATKDNWRNVRDELRQEQKTARKTAPKAKSKPAKLPAVQKPSAAAPSKAAPPPPANPNKHTPRFAIWNDRSLTITAGDDMIELDSNQAQELHEFLSGNMVL